MLGIRKFCGTAIDLWCGDPRDFAVDKYYPDLPADIAAVVNNGLDHISILADSCEPESFLKMLKTLKDELSTRDASAKKLRRLTFIVTDIDYYKPLQSQLFELFSEEDPYENN